MAKPNPKAGRIDIHKMARMLSQLDNEVVGLTARMVKLEAASPKGVANAIKDHAKVMTRIAVALENMSIERSGKLSNEEENEIYEGLKALVETLKGTGKT